MLETIHGCAQHELRCASSNQNVAVRHKEVTTVQLELAFKESEIDKGRQVKTLYTDETMGSRQYPHICHVRGSA